MAPIQSQLSTATERSVEVDETMNEKTLNSCHACSAIQLEELGLGGPLGT